MPKIRIVAVPTTIAEAVRAHRRDPRYNHPAHIETAKGHGPCRHCLRTFRVGAENRILFTYDPFGGLEDLPLPGPIFIHEADRERYPETGGFPQDLRAFPAVLNVYAKGPRLLKQVFPAPEEIEAKLDEVLADPAVDYVEVRDRQAGCFDFRAERAE